MKIMKRKHIVIILTVALIFTAGCGIVENDTRNLGEVKKDYITVASFNIQIFGQTKISKPEIMDVISRIIKRYDVVAIQEVRSKEQNVIPTLLSYVNDANTNYDYIISQRLGRTESKEQYAFVYNTKTVDLIPESSYVVDDPDDVFEREPFVAFFRSGNFDFKLVNNHIKPEDVSAELSQLAVVSRVIMRSWYYQRLRLSCPHRYQLAVSTTGILQLDYPHQSKNHRHSCLQELLCLSRKNYHKYNLLRLPTG